MDWDRRYEELSTPWDLGGITPGLPALLDSGRSQTWGLPQRWRVAVPGCGRGHDLRVFAKAGHDVTGFDLAPRAVAEARRLLALNRTPARVECRDVLGLLPEFAGAFDLAYDYTCLCALPVALREAYVDVLSGILAPRGVVLALVFPMVEVPSMQGCGPPFLVSEVQVRELFTPRFELLDSFAPAASAPGRTGAERWFVWRRRG